VLGVSGYAKTRTITVQVVAKDVVGPTTPTREKQYAVSANNVVIELKVANNIKSLAALRARLLSLSSAVVHKLVSGAPDASAIVLAYGGMDNDLGKYKVGDSYSVRIAVNRDHSVYTNIRVRIIADPEEPVEIVVTEPEDPVTPRPRPQPTPATATLAPANAPPAEETVAEPPEVTEPAPAPKPVPPVEVIPEPQEPENINNGGIPLFGSIHDAHWSLADLLLMLLNVGIWLWLLYLALQRKKNNTFEVTQIEADGSERSAIGTISVRRRMSIVAAAIAAVSVILFFLTQRLYAQVVVFDIWSILFAGLTAGQILTAGMINKREVDRRELI
jgi:hypothetical protein